MSRTATVVVQALMVVVCFLSVSGAVNWDRGIIWFILCANAIALVSKAIEGGPKP